MSPPLRRIGTSHLKMSIYIPLQCSALPAELSKGWQGFQHKHSSTNCEVDPGGRMRVELKPWQINCALGPALTYCWLYLVCLYLLTERE